MADLRETCMDHIANESLATFCSSEQKWINRFRRDAEKYPGQVIVKHINEDGSMVVQYPYAWCKMPSPPRKRTMTDEQRAAASERMKKLVASQKHR